MLKRIYRDTLVEHPYIKGYYQYPNISCIYVSKNGDVISDSNTVEITIYSRMYKILVIKNLFSKVLELRLHRVVCETFLIPDESIDFSKLVVNHIDGNKYNNNLENLEWSSYSDNNYHAYKSGLRTENIPVLVKDLRSGKIVKFYSISEAARSFNLNPSGLYWFLKKENYGKIMRKYYIVIKEGDEWPNVSEADIDPQGGGYDRNLIVLEKSSNTYYLFSTILDAANFMNIKYGALGTRLYRMMKEKKEFSDSKDYRIWYLDKFKNQESNIQDKSVIRKQNTPKHQIGHKPRPVTITNLKDGKISNFNSLKEFTNEIKINYDSFLKTLNRNNNIWKNIYKVDYS